MTKIDFKSGFVAVVGRPNVGKSTLVNTLVGEKIAIVSDRPQTTRNRLLGVMSGEGYQMVFVDTPGIHKPRTQLGSYMMQAVQSGKITEADVDARLDELLTLVFDTHAAVQSHSRT